MTLKEKYNNMCSLLSCGECKLSGIHNEIGILCDDYLKKYPIETEKLIDEYFKEKDERNKKFEELEY